MNSDLIAGVVAVVLGVAVVVLGLRRDLSETTRSGIRQLEADPDKSTATLGLFQGEERPRRRRPSARERRWIIAFYLLFGLCFAAFAVVSGGLWEATMAVVWILGAVVAYLRKPRDPAGEVPAPGR